MGTLYVKTIIKLLLVFTLCLCLDCTNGRTIDSMIARASRGSTYAIPKSGDTPDGFDGSDGSVLTELDMVLTREQYNALHSKQNTPKTSARKKREAPRPLSRRWPNKRVPYSIQRNHFSSKDVQEIMHAIDDWETYTCLTFPPATRYDFDYIYFEENESYCQTSLGMSGGEQPVLLRKDCKTKQVVTHELGHVIGFIHEHSRPDRDDYVVINYENVDPGSLDNFEIFPSEGFNFGVPYDYTSIMHYHSTLESRNGKNTIITIDPAFQEVIGKQDRLSFNDIKLANLMYNCNEQCRSSRRCPKEGFLGKDCRCWCPGNPVKECEENIATESPPVQSTLNPTEEPTRPTERPTTRPTKRPTTRPTERPTTRRTERPTTRPTERPTTRPTERPTTRRTERPTTRPTERPTTERPVNPTMRPTPATQCRDIDPDCADLAEVGSCWSDNYVKTYCKASCFLCGEDIVTKQPPVTRTRKPTRGPTARPTKRPTAPTTCKDADPLCPSWAIRGYCNQDHYVNTHCKASCLLCEEPTTRQPEPATCKDADPRCPSWAILGYCHHDDYMDTHCEASCLLCEGPTERPAPISTCMDMHPDCPTAAKLGYCRDDYYVKTHCKASCSLCEEVTKRPPVKPTRKPTWKQTRKPTDRLITRDTESPIAVIVCTDTDPDCSVWANSLALLPEQTEVFAK